MAVAGQFAQQRGGGIGAGGGGVEIATNDGRHRPAGLKGATLLAQPADELVGLPEAMHARTVVQVQVDERHMPPLYIELGEQKTLFAHLAFAKGDALRRHDRVLRKQGVAIAEVEQARATVIDAEDPMGEAGGLAEELKLVEVARPAGALVNLLQCHEVGLKLDEQLCDFQQREPDAPRRGQALDGRQPATMGDIERDES